MSTGAIPPTGNPDQGPANVPPVPPPAQPLGYSAGMSAVETNSDAKMFGMLCHLLAFCGLVGIPFGNILGPLVIWLVKKDQHPFVNDQGKESLNFQITCTIAGLISAALMLVLIGFVLIFAVLIAWIVLTIIGTINASNGKYYRYPFNIRMIS